MSEVESEIKIAANCFKCETVFSVSLDEVFKDNMVCPKCKNAEFNSITVICPHCQEVIHTNESAIGRQVSCGNCGKKYIANTVKQMDGTPLIVSSTGRVEMHDIASALSMMKNELEEPKKNDPAAKGCLGSLIFIVCIGFGSLYTLIKIIA